jgi:hypothetical protein
MSIATTSLQVDLPVGFVLLGSITVTLATLVLFSLVTLRH